VIQAGFRWLFPHGTLRTVLPLCLPRHGRPIAASRPAARGSTTAAPTTRS